MSFPSSCGKYEMMCNAMLTTINLPYHHLSYDYLPLVPRRTTSTGEHVPGARSTANVTPSWIAAYSWKALSSQRSCSPRSILRFLYFKIKTAATSSHYNKRRLVQTYYMRTAYCGVGFQHPVSFYHILSSLTAFFC